ncbi:MAG TPA: FMN-binding glutamate synthase family protein [Gammaproteobacteria bacterium]|nr:FMN-binding glutamate synthase family protein [Gammaproteobacteria bacterium]
MTPLQSVFWLVAVFVFPASAYLSYSFWQHGYFITLVLGLYVLVGLYDIWFSRHTLNRLYPVAAYFRYALEYIGPEIRQYFVANDTEELPFNREQRALIYRRAQNLDDSQPFGTEHDITDTGWLGAAHSIAPTVIREETKRVVIGGAQCKQPYSASRLNCSAMSFGALSSNAIMTLNRGARLGGFYHNTGEGGYSPYHEQGGDIVWQIGTGYFGCRTPDGNFDPNAFAERAIREQVKMVEIKISQGAKPSHGGVLPAAKVTEEIAMIRLVEMGKDVLSPPAHRTYDSPIGLLDFVTQLRELSGGKPVGFKLCIGRKHEFMAICKAMLATGVYPDFITVDGAEGGTGAAPVEFSNRFGMPCLEGVNFVHNCLTGIGLRDKIKIIASGKTATGFDILTKLAVGADVVNAARTMMLALGCIQSQSCNTNKCPTGIATQNPRRGRALDVERRHTRVANFQKRTLDSAFDMIGAMGIDDPDKLFPHLIWRRNADETSQHFDDVYPDIKNNSLLGDNIPESYAHDWRIASAQTFAPQP